MLRPAQRDDGSRQGGEEQHGADAEQDEVLEDELAGEIPDDRIGRVASSKRQSAVNHPRYS